nr:MAG TPA: Integrase [Caudoviricetes sp.]
MKKETKGAPIYREEVPKNLELRPASVKVRIKYKDDHGETQYYTSSFKYKDYGSVEETIKAAVRDRDAVKAQLKGISPRIWTVDGVYTASLKDQMISVKTQERHAHFYDTAIGQWYGERDIHTITSQDIQESLNRYADTKSEDWMARVLSIWRRIYRQCQVLDLGISDKTFVVKVPKSKKPAPPKRTPADDAMIDTVVHSLTHDIQGHELKGDKPYTYDRIMLALAIRLMQYSGMRPAECFALQKKDIDLKAKVIHVYKAVGSTYKETGKIIATKTAQSVRDIPMSPYCWEYGQVALNQTKHDYVFANYDGSLKDIDQVASYIYTFCRVRQYDFRLYDLRHNFSTKLMEAGVAPAVVRDLMGHSNTATSIAYASSSDEEKQKAVDLIKIEQKSFL